MTEDLKIVFAPGCFDGFEGTQEELDGLVAEVQRMANDGTLLQNSVQLPDDEAEALLNMLSGKGPLQ